MSFGFGLMIVGWMIGLAGYAGMLVCAIQQGVFWVLGLVFVPFFSLFQLAADFRNVWKYWVLNVVGGVVGFIGYMMVLSEVQAELGIPDTVPRPVEDAVPNMPGVYIPTEQVAQDVGLLGSMDPLTFAMIGGVSVFFVVGCVAGLLLIGTMGDPEEDVEPAEIA